MNLTSFQALTLLAKHYKNAPIGTEGHQIFCKVKEFYLMGAKNEADFTVLQRLFNDKALAEYTIEGFTLDQFQRLNKTGEDKEESLEPSYLSVFESINNDPARRYFESTLCHETVKNSIDDLNLADLDAHFGMVFSQMPYTMQLTVPRTIYNGDVMNIATQMSDTAPEYVTALKKLKTKENFESFLDASTQEETKAQSLKEKTDKMRLIVKTAHAAMTAVNRDKKHRFPMDIYGQEGSIYALNRRGRINRVDPKQPFGSSNKQTVKSNNLGIMRSYMPLSRDDVLFEDTSMPTANQYRRPADGSTYVPNADMPNILFKTGVTPFVNSISGTMLCQLRVIAKLMQEGNSFVYGNNPEQLALFFKCFTAYMIYNSGGHSLKEFTAVFELPEVQEMFQPVPGFEQLELQTLFQHQNDMSFLSAMDKTITYTDKMLNKKSLHDEINALSSMVENAHDDNDTQTWVRELYWQYITAKSEEEKILAQKGLLSNKAKVFYKEMFCDDIGYLMPEASKINTKGDVLEGNVYLFDALSDSQMMNLVVLKKLSNSSFIQADIKSEQMRVKFKTHKKSKRPLSLSDRLDQSLDLLFMNTGTEEENRSSAQLILKQINAFQRLRHKSDSSDPITELLDNDEDTINAIVDYFSQQNGVFSTNGLIDDSSKGKTQRAIHFFMETIRKEKRKKYFEVTIENPSLASLVDQAFEDYTHVTTSIIDRELAQEFLIYILNIKVTENVNEAILEAKEIRDLMKIKLPGFIPSHSPLPEGIEYSALAQSIKRTHDFQVTEDPNIKSLFREGDLLDVVTQAKIKDNGGEKELPNASPSSKRKRHNSKKRTIYFNSQERDTYRVDIHDGSFKDHGFLYSTKMSESHGKKGFSAFTLNVNGELSIFPHVDHDKTGIAHSSMNEGKPVVCAGELKIRNGKLLAITTHSGHYRPTLYNVHKTLEYFESRGIDTSSVKLYSFENPAKIGMVSKQSKYPRLYVSNAVDLNQAFKAELRSQLKSVTNDIETYQARRKSFFYWLFSNKQATAQKLQLAKSISDYLHSQEGELNGLKTPEEYRAFILQVKDKLNTFKVMNRQVNSVNKLKKGKLDSHLTNHFNQFTFFKNEENVVPDSSDEREELLKKLGRTQS